MKKIILLLTLLAACSEGLFAQKMDYIKDHHLDEDIFCFNISHKGSMDYSPLNLPASIEKGGLLICPGRFDWIMPRGGTYAYSEGSGILSAALDRTLPTAGFLEMGYGWMFNNKAAKASHKYVTVQYGMGVGFGFRQFYLHSTRKGTLYGLVWPEFSSIISVGNRLEILPKLIFNPIYSGNEWGLRTGSEAMVIYRLLGGFSLNCRVMRERFNFNEKYNTEKGDFSGKAKSRSIQFGFSINIASLQPKFKRD